ncbi:ubiquinone/menaquinone biosynthesis methyltransferase [Leptospira kemamanensis]|uniref:Demethylmenaquinone methyltransferase n=2 Tax=Leptospira kemamanensis TaxID=2484942 RepID=A0A4R9JVP2_9LEPT|nr:ubiquinone/menaquinone biosynthesis methyltransferase [Leptospira kemamanensis]
MKLAKDRREKAKSRTKIKIAGIENVQFMDVSTSMNQYKLPSQEKKPEYVRKNFDGIAKAYDRFNDWNSFFLHRIWKDWVVKEAKRSVPHAKSALDLCCGTGDITYRLSLDPDLETVVGLDFSEQMLSYAFPKVEGQPVKLIVGDAMNLKKFPEGSFDIVTMGFGLRNVSDLRLCLQEIKRVLKKEGVFVNLDVGRVRPRFLKFFADFYFFKIVPLFGYLLYGKQNEMFDYLPHSSKTYPDQETLQTILIEVGFKEVWFRNFVFGNAVAHVAKKGN